MIWTVAGTDFAELLDWTLCLTNTKAVSLYIHRQEWDLTPWPFTTMWGASATVCITSKNYYYELLYMLSFYELVHFIKEQTLFHFEYKPNTRILYIPKLAKIAWPNHDPNLAQLVSKTNAAGGMNGAPWAESFSVNNWSWFWAQIAPCPHPKNPAKFGSLVSEYNRVCRYSAAISPTQLATWDTVDSFFYCLFRLTSGNINRMPHHDSGYHPWETKSLPFL